MTRMITAITTRIATRGTLVAAALLAAALPIAAKAQADELRPIEARSLVLGPVTGVAYYTVEPDGLRVVATLGGDDAQPIRMTATLAPGQSMSLSVPREAGAAPAEVVLMRRGDRLTVVDDATVTH